jgi:pyridoxamine 5'-phosphate oxidase
MKSQMNDASSQARAIELARMRLSYSRESLTESQAHPDPVLQFQEWFQQAAAAGLPEPNAMTLATVSSAGQPSARMVLLKGLEEGDFIFYTNYESRKGRELAENPLAALVFHWPELERQVRVEGSVRRVSSGQSDAYFASRPKGSRLSAWASEQSAPVTGREQLENRLSQLEQQFEGAEAIPRPPYWGGYALRPESIEFWQGRADRLHDRLVYQRAAGGSWIRSRLAP